MRLVKDEMRQVKDQLQTMKDKLQTVTKELETSNGTVVINVHTSFTEPCSLVTKCSI